MSPIALLLAPSDETGDSSPRFPELSLARLAPIVFIDVILNGVILVFSLPL